MTPEEKYGRAVVDLQDELASMRAEWIATLGERDLLHNLLRRAATLFPIERHEWGGDPEWVAAVKRDVTTALSDRETEGGVT